jgi:hypothetical protein
MPAVGQGVQPDISDMSINFSDIHQLEADLVSRGAGIIRRRVAVRNTAMMWTDGIPLRHHGEQGPAACSSGRHCCPAWRRGLTHPRACSGAWSCSCAPAGTRMG